MFISIAIDPAAFSLGDSAGNGEPTKDQHQVHKYVVEIFLEAIRKNGVLVADRMTLDNLVRELPNETLKHKRVEVLVSEFGKNRKKYLAVKEDCEPKGTSEFADLLGMAVDMDADIIICSDADRDELRDLVGRVGVDIEVCSLREYSDSSTARKGREFDQPDLHLGKLESQERDDSIARVVRYADSLQVADRYVGKNVEEGFIPGTKNLKRQSSIEKSLMGIAYLVGLWKKRSPYREGSGCQLEVVLITEVQTVKSAEVQSVIKAMLLKLLPELDPCQLDIKLIRAPGPDIFHARFISAKGRCLTLDPGFDRVGQVGKNNLQFHPDSPANAADLNAIRNAGKEVPEENLSSLC